MKTINEKINNVGGWMGNMESVIVEIEEVLKIDISKLMKKAANKEDERLSHLKTLKTQKEKALYNLECLADFGGELGDRLFKIHKKISKLMRNEK